MTNYAVVTGASKGIGKALAQQLAEKKYNLLLIARSEEKLKALAAELEPKHGITVFYIPLDLAAAGAADTVFNFVAEKKIAVNVLINNAGYGLSGYFEKYTWAQHRDMLNLNIYAVTELTYKFLPLLKQQNQSYILNIGSTAAYQAVPGLSVYAASKAYVLFFSRGLYQELKNTNVSVTCVCPGATETEFSDRAQVSAKGVAAAKKLNMTPQAVAKAALEALFAKKPESVVGLVNKVGTALAWLLPKFVVEKTASSFYIE